MRLIVTSDLHYDHAKSRPSADEVIDQINRTGCDVLIVVGDAAASAGTTLEDCLTRFSHQGVKLFVPGNHELWTLESDSYTLFTRDLPRRVQAIGWRWLQSQPFVHDSLAIVGTLGWYDYSFAQPDLGIPVRFYERKISPGAASYFSTYTPLLHEADDIPPKAMEIVARWNDGRFVKLLRSDYQFLDELLARLRAQLNDLTDNLHKSTRDIQIVAVTHHLPFRQLLPPSHSAQWDFTKAYLGSEKLGALLLEFPHITHVFCGHSHFPAAARIGTLEAANTGCGYRHKSFKMLEL